MKKSEIFDDLVEAFPPEPIEAEHAFDERGRTYPDADEYISKIDSKRWTELDQSYIAKRTDALSFVGSAYIPVLLPAYLNLLIALPPTSPVPETLIPLLTAGSTRPALEERFKGFTARLGDAQRKAVASVLRLFATKYPPYAPEALAAVNSFWE